MSPLRLTQRIIALAAALAVLALILVLIVAPAAFIWLSFFKEDPREI